MSSSIRFTDLLSRSSRADTFGYSHRSARRAVFLTQPLPVGGSATNRKFAHEGKIWRCPGVIGSTANSSTHADPAVFAEAMRSRRTLSLLQSWLRIFSDSDYQ
jgi:hypothetical protein